MKPGVLVALSLLIAAGVPAVANAFDLQGHRGARGLLPENSLPAFAHALSIGVTTLELDTGVTRDGRVVVTHDQRLAPAITRDGNGEWLTGEPPAINALNFAELSEFDVGRIDPMSRLAKRFNEQEPVDGTRIPSLDQVFDLVRKSGNETVRFNIETKINPLKTDLSAGPEQFAGALVDAIRRNGFEDRTAVQSFDWRTLQVVQNIAPELPTVYLTAQQDWFDNVGKKGEGPSPWTAGFDIGDHEGSVARMIKAAGGAVWSPFYRDIDKAKVKEAQELGLQVVVWTVNDELDMKALIDMGVDGIITDYPDRLRAVMQEMGLSLPMATKVDL